MTELMRGCSCLGVRDDHKQGGCREGNEGVLGGRGAVFLYMGGPYATSVHALAHRLSVSQQLTLLHVSGAGSVHMPAAMTLQAVNDQMAVMISLTMVSSCT